jgi:hypothetical protein
VVSGPGAEEAGVNSGLGCLGSGTRANATIGRALKLVLHNVGGARLGGSESSTLGSPAKYTFCFAENREALESLGGWKPYHTDLPKMIDNSNADQVAQLSTASEVLGFTSASDTVVTVLPTVGFNTIVDFQMRDPYELVDWIADSVK